MIQTMQRAENRFPFILFGSTSTFSSIFRASYQTKKQKQVDRSSYGSNTPSDSEDETAAIEKNEKGKEELKEPNTSHPAAESSQRRSRCVSNMYDSWKEVSEEVFEHICFAIGSVLSNLFFEFISLIMSTIPLLGAPGLSCTILKRCITPEFFTYTGPQD